MIIYKATNKINGKCYIGQTTKTLEERRKTHFKRSKQPCNLYLYNAFNKYGFENFSWNILEKCNSIDELGLAEQWYIRKFNCFIPNGYNMSLGGESNYGWIPSKNTRQNQKNAANKRWKSPKERKKASNKQKKVMSDIEYKNKITEKIKQTCNSIQYRNNAKNRQKKLWLDPNYRQKQINTRNTKSFTEKLSKSIKNSWNDPNRKIEMSKQIKSMRKNRKQEFRMFNAKKWKINGQIINDLKTWCIEKNINYNTFYYYKDKKICYNGFKLETINERSHNDKK